MKRKTTLEAMEELNKALRELFFVICEELKIKKLVRWLNDLLKSKSISKQGRE